MKGAGGQRAPGLFGLRAVSGWGLWRLRWGLIAYVLVIDLAALAGAVWALVEVPVEAGNLFPFIVLVICSVLYTEMSRPIEKLRERYSVTPHIDLQSVWMFAAVVTIHPALAAGVITASYFYRWLRVQRNPLYRRTFSTAATIVCGYLAVGFLSLVTGLPLAEATRDVPGFLALVGAGLVFLIANTATLTVAVYYGSPHVSLRTALGSFSDYSLEAATIGLGILLGWALDEWPVALLLIVGITLVLHRSVLVRQLREQARSDRKTGLLNAEAWAEAARGELARGEQLKHSSGLLVLDLDFFKKVNDTHGHLAGDDVLRATAATLQAEVRGGDLVGRFGGEEFVVLLPNIGQAEAVAIAERIRRRVGATAVPLTQGGDGPADITVTVSIGVASHPKDASSLEALMQAADTALYQAKAAGRDRTLLYVAPDEGDHGGLRAVG